MSLVLLGTACDTQYNVTLANISDEPLLISYFPSGTRRHYVGPLERRQELRWSYLSGTISESSKTSIERVEVYDTAGWPVSCFTFTFGQLLSWNYRIEVKPDGKTCSTAGPLATPTPYGPPRGSR